MDGADRHDCTRDRINGLDAGENECADWIRRSVATSGTRSLAESMVELLRFVGVEVEGKNIFFLVRRL